MYAVVLGNSIDQDLGRADGPEAVYFATAWPRVYPVLCQYSAGPESDD